MEHVISKLRLSRYPILGACLAELCGTTIMILYGCGVLAQVKLGKQNGKEHGSFPSISWNWGMAVMLGVFFGGGNGHGHINPAVTFAFAMIGKLSWIRVPLYTICQTFGAFLGALVVLAVNLENIRKYAHEHDADQWLVNTTGDIFVTNPWISQSGCFIDQFTGTALLTAGALAITDKRTWNLPDYLHPFFLGLLVFSLVQAYAVNAGCALNPARDFGPRLMILMCGWKTAFSAGNYYFWVPIVGPYLGATAGAVLYELTIGIHVGISSRNVKAGNQSVRQADNP
ncbi:hypothetical protein AHF37_03549 [Paragonimus kellicotti]|nr:hypothetical protein AHF37_03549 [Paragonimus kellicotti]